VKSPFEPNIKDTDIIEEEFNLLSAVGLLQTDTRGRYLLAIPQFDAAGFKAAVERESQRRSDEFDQLPRVMIRDANGRRSLTSISRMAAPCWSRRAG
jgi:hypothetical protein